MALVNSGIIIDSAVNQNYAIGAFNVIQIEHAEAIVSAAEQVGADVILQLSQNAVAYHGALEPIGSAMLAIAKSSTRQVSVHIDHAENTDLIAAALDLGFNSVMYDGSHHNYTENLRITKEMVKLAHSKGAWLEAELGEIGGKDGVHAATARTIPSEAAEFVADTGVDALAVAIGSSHAMTDQSARIDFDLVSQLAAAVDVPLVMHGSSGVAIPDIQKAISLGIRKVNISTELNKNMTNAIAQFMAANPKVVDPRKYLGAGRDAVTEAVAHYLSAFSLELQGQNA